MSEKLLPVKLQNRIKAMISVSSVKKEDDYTLRNVKVNLNAFLPDVGVNRRAIPNMMLRCALFGVVGRERKYEDNVLKAAINGLTIRFTGKQLDQSDLDVYLECVRRCSKHPAGDSVRFFAYDFLKKIERSCGKSQYVWLSDSLRRLTASLVEISDGRIYYSGHLLDEINRDEDSKEFIISLNPKMVELFSDDLWTGLSISERNRLKGKQLSQWLHGFYSTHSNPYPYKVETIHELCGSSAVLWKFRQTLKKSLSDLSSETGWRCKIDDSDCVSIRK
ncbi:plasmid replication initiator TrfA [Plesiomonas sp. PI-19]|uniref:plasmid replication initiator TrfA n=1 Tax=Plesiomonas sp. PI-19 TaxID=2898798 RepID=UPI001F460C5B|nr:hypothetical protein [Plesiomonas sp. PI-19]